VADVRVQNGHQVQRLHDVRAVLAGQGEVGLEGEFAFETLNLFDDVLAFLGRVAADLQQGQHQGSEFVAHRQTGEGQADVAVDTIQGERGAAGIRAVCAQGELVTENGDVQQQDKHHLIFRAISEERDDLDRHGDLFDVGLQLGYHIAVQRVGRRWFRYTP